MAPTVAIAIFLAIGKVYLGLAVTPGTFSWAQAFKDLAHVYTGALGWSWYSAKRMKLGYMLKNRNKPEQTMFFAFIAWVLWQPWQWHVFVFLCILEVVVATLSRL